MKIYLLRHGQTITTPNFDAAHGHPNPALDEIGIQQAGLLGKRLQNCGIEAIYSSDLGRTRETAGIVNGYIHTDVLLKPQLREIDMGRIFVEGWQSYPEYYREWKKHESDLPYPGGESGADVQKRAWPVVDEILKRHSRDVAIVTHAGVIMVLLAACLEIGQEKRFRLAAPGNCSISTLVFDLGEGRLKIECFNETTHLDIMATKP